VGKGVRNTAAVPNDIQALITALTLQTDETVRLAPYLKARSKSLSSKGSKIKMGFVIPESLKSTHSSNSATAKKSTLFSILVAKPHAP
jgi:hypothetical protein